MAISSTSPLLSRVLVWAQKYSPRPTVQPLATDFRVRLSGGSVLHLLICVANEGMYVYPNGTVGRRKKKKATAWTITLTEGGLEEGRSFAKRPNYGVWSTTSVSTELAKEDDEAI